MSHSKERKEKNCLNCNARVQGRYCHICGQENLEPAESVWHLTTHFFNDITHFDGKFFSTAKYLMFRPGYLSREYQAGRRSNYLNPVRMYIFTSAVFFFVFFSTVHNEDRFFQETFHGKTKEQITEMDSAQFLIFSKKLENDEPRNKTEYLSFIDNNITNSGFFADTLFRNPEEYQSAIQTGAIHPNWIQNIIHKKNTEMYIRYKGKRKDFFDLLSTNMFHSLPQILLLCLPLFALILKLLYIRRKQFFYTNHLIFCIHISVFLLLLILFAIGIIKFFGDFAHLGKGLFFLVLLFFFYEYKAMRNFYFQGRAKTILKLFIADFLLMFVVIFIFLGFSFISFLKM